MVYIYVLELQQKKHYIGKTDNPKMRLDTQFQNKGSAWTKKYKPIQIIELIPDCDNFDEDKYTLKYMQKYGINNVRGGSFCQIKLSDNNIITLEQIIKSVTDKCYICGKNDHFAIDCKEKSVKTEKIPTINLNEKCDCPTSYIFSHRRKKCALNKIISYFDNEADSIDKLLKQQQEVQKEVQKEQQQEVQKEQQQEVQKEQQQEVQKEQQQQEVQKEQQIFICSYCDKEFETKKGATYHENIYCKVKKSKESIFMCSYCDKEFETEKGAIYHENIHCKVKKEIKRSDDTCKKNSPRCNKCGRKGHWSSKCYASKDVYGEYI